MRSLYVKSKINNSCNPNKINNKRTIPPIYTDKSIPMNELIILLALLPKPPKSEEESKYARIFLHNIGEKFTVMKEDRIKLRKNMIKS